MSATFEHPIKFSSIPLNKAISTLVDSEKQRIKILERNEKQVTKLWDSIPDFIKDDIKNEENRFQNITRDKSN